MKYGLIGEKLGHSFSKEIHKKFADYEYELCEIPRDRLDSFMKQKDFLGINVTIPYKVAVIPFLDWVDAPVNEIGAVNTIIQQEGKLYGYNTDYFGMKALIDHAGIEVGGKKAAILGSGGTSRTAYAVLKSLGAGEIIKVSSSGKEGAVSYNELYDNHSDVEIIINTTPVGMFPDILDCAVDLSKFNKLIGVIDAIYNPINTTLVQNARELGIKAEGGLYMLVAQAAMASELFLDENGNTHPHFINKAYEEVKATKENIVLIGMPASGKTTVGKILAERLERRFVDTDELIEEQIGMSIKEYFECFGEEKFRRIESEIIGSLAGENSLVIATGGGAILREENVSALKYNGKLYFIDRPLDLLVPTVSRPLSSDRASVEMRYKERYSIYCDVCDVRIDAMGDAETVAEKIPEKKMKIYVLNGPNLNMLGIREPDKYGTHCFGELISMIQSHCRKLNIEAVCYQSNHEGELVDKIQEAYFEKADGIVINPGAYTHTSIALLDAVKAVSLPTVEVHISDVTKREDFRQVSYIRSACKKTIMGHGIQGYIEAIDYLVEILK